MSCHMSLQVISCSCNIPLPFSVKNIFVRRETVSLCSKMRIEELVIEQVKQHDVLYDTKSFNYKDHYVRQQAWEEIGRDLQITAETAKKTWNTLRRCFLNAISRRRKKSGEAARKIIPWKYELQMSFLLPFIDSGKGQSSTQEGTQDELHGSENAQELKYNVINNETSTHQEMCNTISRDEASRYIEGSRREASNNTLSPAIGITRTSRYEAWQARDMDETDMFFFSMAKMTKRLPLLEQAKIKLQLSNSVLQAQIRLSENMEQERPSSVCSASSSTSANFVTYDPHNLSIRTQQ